MTIKRYQVGGTALLSGPIQAREYVPLPYAQAFEMQRLNEADRATKEQGILNMYKGFYDTAMQAPPNMQDEALAEIRPYLDRIEQGLAEAGGDPLRYRGGMDVMKSFYTDMATGRLGSLQQAGSQYAATKKDYDKLNELHMRGKGGVPESISNLALQIGLQNAENSYDAGGRAVFSPPNLVEHVNVLDELGSWLSQKEADGFTDSQGNKIEQITAETLLPIAKNYMMMDDRTRGSIMQEIDLNMAAGNYPMDNVNMDEILKDKTYAKLYNDAITAMPLGLPEDQAQALASQQVYRAKLIDDRMNNFAVAGIQPFLQTDVTQKQNETDISKQVPYTVSDSPVIPIDRSTAMTIGAEIMDMDAQLKNLQAQINAGGPQTEQVLKQREELLNRRQSALLLAANKSEAMINDKAMKSPLWRDEVFTIKLKGYYDDVKDASDINLRLMEGVSLNDFTNKAKILSAIPGLTSIGLLPGSPAGIMQLQGLTVGNYPLLGEYFEEGESIMPYLQAAQWIQRKAKRADVLNTYEKSLRVPLGQEDSYLENLTQNLTQMVHNGNLAFADFYANEDVTAEVKNFKRPIESIKLQPTLSMIDGSPAYKLDFYDYNKVKGSKDVEISGVEKTEYVRGTNQRDELIRYEDLGVQLINLSQSDPNTQASQAYLKDGIQVVANARILSPIQMTGIETADLLRGSEDAQGNPYVEINVPGFNFKVRRTDYPGNVSIFDLRNNENKLIPYFPNGEDQPAQPIRSGSLEDIAYQYFMFSQEPIDNSGTLGRQIIQQYINR